MAIDTIGTNAIANDAVTAAKIPAGAVDADITAIPDGSVTTAKLAADAVTAAKLADDSVVTANIVDGAVTTAKGGGAFNGRRNYIINGDFQIAQRANSASVGNGTYVSLDRWKAWAGSAATVFSKQDHTVGQTDVPQASFYARAVVSANSASGAYSTINQHIENVLLSNSQQMTLSFYAKASSAGLKIGIEPIQNFGTGGSPSSRVLIAGTAKTLTTSWARYTHTFTFGSVSGKSIGTTADSSSFEIGFWLSGGSDYNARTGSIGNQAGTFEISHVQLENGPTATPFENLSQSETLLLCQRYYNKGGDSFTYGQVFSCNTGSNAYCWVRYPVQMRAAPSLTLTSSGQALYVSGNSKTINGRVPQNADRVGFQYNLQVNGVAGSAGHFDASAPFYVAEAEL